MKNNILIALICVFLFFTNAQAQDRPLPPREAPLRMTLPEGFKATLFAGEPDLVQPIAMCFDQRGRLWVAECMSYPGWLSDLTKGRDRILIFEDTDGDGVFDKRTVFQENLANVTAIQVGFGGVFVGATPHLLFIPDKNGDDVPDGPPQVLLDGFDIKTGHTAMNSLTWGPDGWLYGCHGLQAIIRVGKPETPKEQRPVMDAGVWRYHPTRHEFEVFAHGTTNPWGLDFDDHGQMFITNCVIGHLWHVQPGAHFERMYGQDVTPHVYGLMKMCADHLHWGGGDWTSSRATKFGVKSEHSDAGGGHAHVGCMVYLGDNFPDRYRNGVFMCNLHGNRVNHDILETKGSSYIARHGKDFLFANDPWFRGISLCYGPDGAVYVSDWSDTGECHNYKVVDRSNGRVFKVSFGQPKNPSKTLGKNWDLSKLPDADLVRLQQHKNELFVRMARRILQERAGQGKLAAETRGQLLQEIIKATTSEKQLRALWAYHVTGGLEESVIEKLVQSNDIHDHVRTWVVRLAFEKKSNRDAELAWIKAALMRNTPRIRAEFASALQRTSGANREKLSQKLLSHSEDAEDPLLPLLLWYGAEPILTANNAARFLRETKVPLVREYMARRLTTLDATAKPWQAAIDLLYEIDEPTLHRDILRGLSDGFKGQRHIDMPECWVRAYPNLVASPLAEVRELSIALAVQFGDQRAFQTLEKLVTDRKEPASKRQAALAPLLFQQERDLLPVLRILLDDNALRAAAIKGLARFDDPQTPELILNRYAGLNPEEKVDAVHTLTARPASARALLEAMAKGNVPRQDVSAFNARQILALGNPEITATLAKVWGTIRPASQEKAALMKKYKDFITPDRMKHADLVNGRLLYQKTCATCHKLFGDGGAIGPDLTGSQRSNLDYVLENMLDPSAIVAKDYQVTILTTSSGRTLTGIIKQENDKAITVQTQNELIVLPKGDIESRVLSPLSMMPEGQLDPLTMLEVRDLIAFLASPMQVPLPGGKK